MNYRTVVTLVLAGWVSVCHAYETETHALITRAAFGRSSLNDYSTASVLTRLGLNRLNANSPFWVYWDADALAMYYPDGEGNDPETWQQVNAFERCQMQEFFEAGVNPDFARMFEDTVDIGDASEVDGILPIQNWLVRGAIREDDLGLTWEASLFFTNCRWAFFRSGQAVLGLTPRVFNHFFDPVWDRAMPSCLTGNCKESVNWALGYVDSFSPFLSEDTSRGNHFSYIDARNFMWWALTRERLKEDGHVYTAEDRELDAMDRMYLWSSVFRSLGDVVHLLEDTGQPQHTRNDPHSFFQSAQQQAFEGFTNLRVLGGSLVEANSHVRAFFPNSSGDGPLDPPPLGEYPIVKFGTPARFFSTRYDNPNVLTRAGLADYTNRGFFTGGTLPPDQGLNTPHDYPPLQIEDSEGHVVNDYVRLPLPCMDGSERVTAVVCDHYLHTVPDAVAGAYADELPSGYVNTPGNPIRVPLLANSVFRTVVENYITGEHDAAIDERKFALGLDELTNIGNLTIPRAVAYATGMIDYFFRGRIDLEPPPGGLYAVADQGIAHHTEDGVAVLSDDSKAAMGFTTLRVRARNTTADIQEPAGGPLITQIMHGGELVAIARYHRNPCYQPDLSGELVYSRNTDGSRGAPTVPSGCATSQSRTAFPEISVSSAIPIDGGGNLPGHGASTNVCANEGSMNLGVFSVGCQNQKALLEFDFSNDPIPINATDLFIQVAYRGKLGDEEDGIAVGSIDILEPNYFSLWNNTDYVHYNDVWTLNADVPTPPGPYDVTPVTSAQICFDDQLIATLKNQQQLGARDFIRVAMLTDVHTLHVWAIASAQGEQRVSDDGNSLPSQREAAMDDIALHPPYAPDPMSFYGRGTVLGLDFSQWYWWSGDETQESYTRVLTLEPALAGQNGPGLASPADVHFFPSEASASCAAGPQGAGQFAVRRYEAGNAARAGSWGGSERGSGLRGAR